MITLGVDLAGAPENTAVCRIQWSAGGARASFKKGVADDELLGRIAEADKTGIDAPFGWPDAFVEALVAHRRQDAWPMTIEGRPARPVFRRTDHVTALTRRPLSVAADRIGVVAMRCAHVLSRCRADVGLVDRSGVRGKVAEVYPAGALARWGWKGREVPAAYERIERELPGLRCELGAEEREDEDAFDALVASLVARAIALGLTDEPPPAAREVAAREGWIHLPRRGPLRWLAADPAQLSVDGVRDRARTALQRRLAYHGATLDAGGRAQDLAENLVPGLPPGALVRIAEEIGAVRRPQLREADSAVALAASTFGPWLDRSDRADREPPRLGEVAPEGAPRLHLDAPAGLRAGPPALQVLWPGTKTVVAVETACTETLTLHDAGPSSIAADGASPSWRAEHDALGVDPRRYRHLDAARLVRRYLTLVRAHPTPRIALVYLWWEPRNADELQPFSCHAAEVAEFAARVRDRRVRFVPLSLRSVWDAWAQAEAAWLHLHVQRLRARYDIEV